jgi:hippurate hydrolase
VPIKNRLAELMPEIAGWRREIHMHPELGYDLPRTTALVEEKLRAFGVDEVVTGVGQSGIVAVIRGKTDTKGHTVGLRADMDALPMTEATGLPHASTIPGRMHGCGHDGHTAMLLGTAKYLAETRNFDGTAVMIFQPAEEGGAGGEAMVKDGLMERFGIDEVYGMHNEPGLPVGEFGVSPGPIMAAADEFEVRVVGKGGHAARPHLCIDPTPAACNVVMALQTVASRNTDPIERIVVSVCTMKTSSEAHNVIPMEVLLRGTVRTLSDEVRDMAERRVTRLIHSTAEAYDCEAHVNYMRGYPVVVNHDANAEMAAEIARAVAGEDKVRWGRPPRMGGEDFAYMLNARPGAFINVGNGDTAGVHHPMYDFNDEAIPHGCSFFAELVERRMPAA